MPERLAWGDVCKAADEAVAKKGMAASARDVQKLAPGLPRSFATAMVEWAKQRVRITDYQTHRRPHVTYKLRSASVESDAA